jgi:hypothetical protein
MLVVDRAIMAKTIMATITRSTTRGSLPDLSLIVVSVRVVMIPIPALALLLLLARNVLTK